MPQPPADNWITSGLLVMGALGTFVAIGSWLAEDPLVLLAFVAGGGWLLVLPLLVMNRRDAREKHDLRAEAAEAIEKRETEIRDLRQQVSEWRTVATQDSESLNRFVNSAVAMPRVVPRRALPIEDPHLQADQDGEAEQ